MDGEIAMDELSILILDMEGFTSILADDATKVGVAAGVTPGVDPNALRWRDGRVEMTNQPRTG